MKQLRISGILLLLIIFGFTETKAQDATSRISGRVFDPEMQAAEYSTVVLMNRDSVFISGTLTGEDGVFHLEKLKAGDYLIMVRNVEFNTHVSELISLGEDAEVKLPDIHLTARINDLEEVVIKGEKAMVEVHADKMVYNVSASANATGNNALELMAKSPGVMVDMDKNIILQGKAGVQIYINGRPSRISGSDLSNMLESMPSEDIEAIEIIANPSSKYDAEGTGGIINIILKKSLDTGFNGSVRGNYSKGRKERSALGTSLNYSNGKVNMFSSVNVMDNNYFMTDESDKLREKYLLEEESSTVSRRQGINLAGGMDYQINREHVLSLDARVLLNDRTGLLESTTNILDLMGIEDTEQLKAGAEDDGLSNNINTNLHYGFTPNRSSSFSADLSYGSFANDNTTFQPNAYYTGDGSSLLRTINSRYSALTDISIMSAKVDYEHRINKFTLSTGSKYSYINTDNSLAFYNFENEVPVLDVSRSNAFSYLEKVAAAYVIVNNQLTEQISLNVGLRVENTSSLGTLESSNPGPDDVVPRNYTSLFPNASLSYNDQQNHALSLSFGRRITRPNYQNLNPFESKTSELSSWKGNPFLKPNYIENYQLTYSFRRKLVISNTYSVTHNYFANVYLTNGDKGDVLGPQNMDKVTNNGLSVSYPLKVAKWWEFSGYFIYNNVSYGGDIQGAVINLSANIFNLRVQNNLKLPGKIEMEISAYLSSPWIWGGTVNVDGYYNISAGIKREFMDGRLLLQASANDIFNTGSNYYYSSDYGGINVDGVIFFDGRRIALSASYNFGNQKVKARRSKSSMDEELRRISTD